jgi:hypothetical protein
MFDGAMPIKPELKHGDARGTRNCWQWIGIQESKEILCDKLPHSKRVTNALM